MIIALNELLQVCLSLSITSCGSPFTRILAPASSILIDGIFPITSFADAFERKASGRARGKILLNF